MSDYTPKFKPGQAVTFAASADITGGRVVEISGDREIATSAADSAKAFGIAGFDANTGDNVTVFIGGVQRPIAGGVIAAGAKVTTDATGKVVALGAGTNPIGRALQAATADGDVIDVLFN